MDAAERARRLREFKQALVEWRSVHPGYMRRGELEAVIEQNRAWARQEVLLAGCLKIVALVDPPHFGGTFRIVDAFKEVATQTHETALVSIVSGMIDDAIAVLESAWGEPPEPSRRPRVRETVATREGHALLAIDRDPRDPERRPVVEAIEEGAARCGIRVEVIETIEAITDRILDALGSAEFVIVELTRPTPSVCYMAGYARGIGTTPICVAKASAFREMKVEGHSVSCYGNLGELKAEVEGRIRALRYGPGRVSPEADPPGGGPGCS